MWLAEVAGTRILTDPLLGESFHDGLFRVHPRRSVAAERLRPDLIVVSHRHPDHFDLDSLYQLAQIDPTAVVLTADDLVARACRRLGFESVGVLADWDVVPLDGARLLTTPSYCRVVEWGLVVATDEGVVWNQVDTVLEDAARVRSVWEEVQRRLGVERCALGLVAWQPLREIEPHVYGRLDFPRAGWQQAVERAVALGADCVVPSASGHHHIGEASWLNAHAYPVSEERFRRVLAEQDVRCDPGTVGTSWSVRAGQVVHEAATDELVAILPAEDTRAWRPDEVPPLRGWGDAADRALVHTWVEDVLAPALATRLSRSPWARLQLDVSWEGGEDGWTFHWDGSAVSTTRGHTPYWDRRNHISGGHLARVLRGEAHWGRPLLAGQLRHQERLTWRGERVAGGVMFLYDALSYDVSTERWVEHRLRALSR